MISIQRISDELPFKLFLNFYEKAFQKKQSSIEAAAVCSFNSDSNEAEARFVNIKYLINNEFIFFSNYKSIKARNFDKHDQVTLLFYWNVTDVQIRIKGKIVKSDQILSDKHYYQRSSKKNALAHSSNQSNRVDSHENVILKYDETLNSSDILSSRPSHWGGYSIKPYYFEFWEGNEYRINKRTIYELTKNDWKQYFLSP